jgi:hypothetical protein
MGLRVKNSVKIGTTLNSVFYVRILESLNVLQLKKTLWLLVCKRTILTERPPLVNEI